MSCVIQSDALGGEVVHVDVVPANFAGINRVRIALQIDHGRVCFRAGRWLLKLVVEDFAFQRSVGNDDSAVASSAIMKDRPLSRPL